MGELTDDEKEHVRQIEEYRAALRKELGTNDKGFFLTKIFAPGFLVVLTAFLSGLFIPHILRVDDDLKRRVDLKSRLIDDVVADSATAQMAMSRYNEQLCDYWNASLRVELRKRNLQRNWTAMDPELRRAENDAIAADRKRENDLRIEFDKVYADNWMKSAVATSRLESGLRLYYGESDELKQYLSAESKDAKAADDLLNNAHQDRLAAIYAETKKALQTCADDAQCGAIAEAAGTKIGEIRGKVPSFEKWRTATQALAGYIVTHDPNIGSR